MPEQTPRKKWNKPLLISLGKIRSVEEACQHIDEIKQAIQSAQQTAAQPTPPNQDKDVSVPSLSHQGKSQ